MPWEHDGSGLSSCLAAALLVALLHSSVRVELLLPIAQA
jgi:hypothetical protein